MEETLDKEAYLEMKWNEWNEISFFSKIKTDLQQFQATPENKNTMKLINYQIFMIKKKKQTKLGRKVFDG